MNQNEILLAPNGQPTNLTPTQYNLVRTPAFKSWFGDWEFDPMNASKVVDINGEPLVVYHGSEMHFNIFDKRNRNIDGFFFSSDKETSRTYGENIYEVFLKIDKPFLVDANHKQFDEDLDLEVIASYPEEEPYTTTVQINSDDIVRLVMGTDKGFWKVKDAEKYNGVFLFNFKDQSLFSKRTYSQNSFVAFKPNQIKLADGTNTTFDINNDDIRYADGGSVSTRLLAPNGQPSNLTPEQYNLVRTPAFKAWFGDWEFDPQNASKVVDANGEPLVVYHGTNNEFTVFDSSNFNKNEKSGDFIGEGFFFTSEIEKSRKYGLNTKAFFLNSKTPIIVNEFKDFEKIRDDIFGFKQIGNVSIPYYFELKKNNPSAIRTKFIELGYDGLIDNLYNQFAVFEPNQIKLADGTNTTFDMNNTDIRFEDGGSISTTLLAPNGKTSNLTPEQYNLVRTPAFKAWFGDWENDPQNSSKVIDSNGEPLVVYHGSDKQFTTFKNSDVGELGLGVYFSSDKEVGERYKFKNSYSNTSKVYECFLNVKKPYLLSGDTDDLYSEFIEVFLEDYNLRGGVKADRIATETLLKKHDGCISQKRKMFVVYYPNQIKLADGTNTTFDMNNPDIRFEDGGSIPTTLLAPNGKPTNLTPEQYKLVRTPEFKAWFGDWEKVVTTKIEDSGIDDISLNRLYKDVSKMVDSNGEPLVCFHGTNNKFTVFDKNRHGSSNDEGFYGSGFYFTFNTNVKWKDSTRGEAGYYGKYISDYFIRALNPFNMQNLQKYKGDVVNLYGTNTLVFLYNLAKQFPDLAEIITIEQSITTDEETLDFEIREVPISIIPKLVDKYAKELKVFETTDSRGDKAFNGYVKSTIETYTVASTGKTRSFESFDELGMVSFNCTKNEVEIVLIESAIEKYDRISMEYHMEGYMTRYKEITEKIKETHDCIIQTASGDELVVFEPNQIKLADGTNTTFDMNNPDTRFDKGGNIDLNASFDVNGKTLADRVRQLVKELYPDYKWSITSKYNKLDVYLLEADFDPFTELWKNEYPDRKKEYNVTNSNFESYNREEYRAKLTERALEVFKPIRDYINKFVYNSNAGDPSADYPDYNVYENTYIGKWDKPYVQVEPKLNTKKVPASKPVSAPTPTQPSPTLTSTPTASAKPTFKPIKEKIVGYYLHSFYNGKVVDKFEITELIDSRAGKFKYKLKNLENDSTTTQTFNIEDLTELFKMDEYEGFLLVPNENYVEPVKPQPAPTITKAVEPKPAPTTLPKPVSTSSNTFKPLQEKMVGYYLYSFYDRKVDEKFEIVELIESKADKFRYRIRNIDTNNTTTQTFSKEDIAELFKMDEYEGYQLVAPDVAEEPAPSPEPSPTIKANEEIKLAVEGKFYCLNNEPSYIQVTESTPEIVGYDFYDFEDIDKKTPSEESDPNFIKLFIETWKLCTKPKFKRDESVMIKNSSLLLAVDNRRWENNSWSYKMDNSEWIDERNLEKYSVSEESIQIGDIYAGLNSPVYFEITSITPEEINYKNFGKQNEFVSNGLMKTSEYTYKNFQQDYILLNKPKYQIEVKVNLIDGAEGVSVVNRKPEKLSSGKNSWMYLISSPSFDGWISEAELAPFIPTVGQTFADGSGYFLVTESSPERIVCEQYGIKNERIGEEAFSGMDNVNNFRTISEECTIPKFIDGQEVIINETNEKSFISYRTWSESEKVWDYELTDRQLGIKSENELSSVETKTNDELPKVGQVFADGKDYLIVIRANKKQIYLDSFNEKNEVDGFYNIENKAEIKNFLSENIKRECTIPKFIDGQEVIINSSNEKSFISSRTWSESEKVWNYELTDRQLGIKSENELSSVELKADDELPKEGDAYIELKDNSGSFIIVKIVDFFKKIIFETYNNKNEEQNTSERYNDSFQKEYIKCTIPKFKKGEEVIENESKRKLIIESRSWNSSMKRWVYMFEGSYTHTAYESELSSLLKIPQKGEIYAELNRSYYIEVTETPLPVVTEDTLINFDKYISTIANGNNVLQDVQSFKTFFTDKVLTTKPRYIVGDKVGDIEIMGRMFDLKGNSYQWKYIDSKTEQWFWEDELNSNEPNPQPEMSIEEYFLNNFDSANEIPRKYQITTALLLFVKSAVELKEVATVDTEKYLTIQQLITEKLK